MLNDLRQQLQWNEARRRNARHHAAADNTLTAELFVACAEKAQLRLHCHGHQPRITEIFEVTCTVILRTNGWTVTINLIHAMSIKTMVLRQARLEPGNSVRALAMARRLGFVLALGAVVLLAAAATTTAQSDKGKVPPKAEGPKPNGEGPKPKPKPKQVKCNVNRKENPYCFNKKMDCPDDCPETCFASCTEYDCKAVCACDQPGAACGDPRFIGGDGNAFYFHGRKDADFCVVSDRDLHINAHFIGKSGHSGMSRDFTWIQAIAVLFDGHHLYVGARKTGTWDDAVEHLEITLDGEPVHLPADQVDAAKWTSSRVPALSLTRTKAANGVLVALDGKFSVRVNAVPITEEDSRVHRYGVTSDDCLAHLELAFKFDALTDDVHGVVGQTYRSDYVNKLDVRASMPTMGGDASFTASSLFAADCAVARFGTIRSNNEASVRSELAGITCASGMDGQGVVCKK
ncbi:uncharacterized protein LOC124656270 [Lolium rigidum]|uniref:uncharacterized protein LOC124656270 n=1 Tax=Lolium rigidum TaxID=89674 RepID=UPI001F5E1FCF|nr:uncharacterized protein LOC124656270 [Lolium rigidum]